MARKPEEAQERPRLAVPRGEAEARVREQIERGEAAPNASINESEEARRWYEFTAEVLRQILFVLPVGPSSSSSDQSGADTSELLCSLGLAQE